MPDFQRERSPGRKTGKGPGLRSEAAGRKANQQRLTEEALRLTRFSLDHARESIFWVGRDGRLLYGNRQFCRSLGYSPAEILSRRIWDVAPRMKEAAWPERWRELKNRRSLTFEGVHATRAGEHFPVEVSISYGRVGGKEYLFSFARDIRLRKAVEAHLRESEQRYRMLFESSSDAILLLKEGRIVDCNYRAIELLGRSREEILSSADHVLESAICESGEYSPGVTEKTSGIRNFIRRALDGEVVAFSLQIPRTDSAVELQCTLTRVDIEGRTFLLLVAADVTERLRTERSLSQLSGRLQQLQDEERRRIARELHDSAGQNMAALQINLSLIAQAVNQANTDIDPRIKDVFRESLELAESSLREIRTMSYLLHPPMLDELGLVTALRSYADGYSERTGIQLTLDLPPHMDRLPQQIEIALFRMVQEGLTNIHRHSGSATALLRLKRSRDTVELDVIDHGRGLPQTLDLKLRHPSRIGVGIAGMQERARQLGGRLFISSTHGGTALHVLLPVPASKERKTKRA